MRCRKKARITYLYEFVSGLEVTMGVRKFCHKWNICNFDCEFEDASHRLAWKRRFCHKYYIVWLSYHSKTYKQNMVFENLRKSLIGHCERSELSLHFEWAKFHWKSQKWPILVSFLKHEACSQTVLPDRSVLIGQKLGKNAKVRNSNETFSGKLRFTHLF